MIKDSITLAVALLGALLGIINLVLSVFRERVRLRILPQEYFTSHGDQGLCFDVVNCGFTPVTITMVGLSIQGGKMFQVPTGELPKRLEPRTALTIYWPPGASQNPCLADGRQAVVRTACGRSFRGNSPALKARIETAKKARNESAYSGSVGG